MSDDIAKRKTNFSRPPARDRCEPVADDVDEQTHLYESKRAVPRPRTSQTPNLPRLRPPPPNPAAIPAAPRLPADFAAAMRQGNLGNSPEIKKTNESDCTRAYTAEIVEELLRAECDDPSAAASSAADEDTRFGQIPIDELIAAKGGNSDGQVGHEDVTKAYELNPSEPASDDTLRVSRVKLSIPAHEASVIIRAQGTPLLPRWLPFVALVATTAVLAWVFASPIRQQVRKARSVMSRQVTPAPSSSVASTPNVTVSISASPADARIVLDGVQITNPFLAQRRFDVGIHELTVDAPGYAPVQRKVQFERDLTVVMALAPIEPVHLPTLFDTPAPTQAPTIKSPTAGKNLVHMKSTLPGKAAAHAKPTPAAKAPMATEVPGKSNCNPPFTVDDLNIKTFKPECL